jgi:hypothetical protein
MNALPPEPPFLKADLTNRWYEVPPEKPPGTIIDRWLINPSGVSASIAYQYGDAHQRSNLRAMGAALYGSSLLTAFTITAGVHVAFGDGNFHPSYFLCGLFIGGLAGLGDYLLQYKPSIEESGQEYLRRNCGLKLAEADAAKGVPRFIRVTRLTQAGIVGGLGSVFIFILADSGLVQAHINRKFLEENKASAAIAARIVDEQIARAKRGFTIADGNVVSLSSSLRRLSNRKPTQTARERLEREERQINEQSRGLDERAASVGALEDDRFRKIEKLIMEYPGAIPRDNGFGGKIDAYFSEVSARPLRLIFLAAWDLFSLLLECLPLWLAATKIPSPLAGRIVLDQYVQGRKLRLEANSQLDIQPYEQMGDAARTFSDKRWNTGDALFQSRAAASSGLNGATPPKRGRGRPRNDGLPPGSITDD